MMLLLSIKPDYATRIFDGTKKFEFRRVVHKRPVKRALVYASLPVGRVIGEFIIDELICEEIDILWKMTKGDAGITKDEFYKYFLNCNSGYAIKIGNIKKYKIPKQLFDNYGLRPPQSFAYIV